MMFGVEQDGSRNRKCVVFCVSEVNRQLGSEESGAGRQT